MLKLWRTIGKKIIIDGDISVEILKAGNGRYGRQYLVGIIAPDEVSVDREEIHLRKMKERDDECGNR